MSNQPTDQTKRPVYSVKGFCENKNLKNMGNLHFGRCITYRMGSCHPQLPMHSVVWCLIKRMIQYNKNLKPTKIIYIPFHWHSICSIYSKSLGDLFQQSFCNTRHYIFSPMLCLSLFQSFSLSPSSAYSSLCSYLPQFDIKDNQVVWSE